MMNTINVDEDEDDDDDEDDDNDDEDDKNFHPGASLAAVLVHML